MRRSQLESILFDYANGDLDEDACREIERRLESDPHLRALYEEVRSAHGALRLLRERPEPPVSARDAIPRIQAAIAAQAFESRPRLYLEGMGARYYRRLAIAATLLFAVTAGYVALVRPDVAAEPAPVGIAPPQVSTAGPGLERVVEMGGRREGITAEEYFRILDELESDSLGLNVAPVVNVVPVADDAALVR